MRRILALLLACAAGNASARTIADERAALESARAQAREAIARSQKYEAAAAKATDAAERARAEAAAIASRIQESESRIAAAEARIRIIERLRAAHRRRLAERQQPIARLLAALETMARRPSALIVAQPGAITDMIHTRLLLSSTLPIIEERTKALRGEIARGAQLRQAADAAVLALHRHQAALNGQRIALARIEATERLRSRKMEDAAFLEQERAQGLGEKARDISNLMTRMDAQAILSSRLATLSGPLPRPQRPGDAPPPSPEQDRRSPSARPDYRLPVIGQVVTGLGEVSASGVRSRGLTFAVRPGAQVIAPAGGRIRFAGPFRGYGGIVIIDHGGGWTTLVRGLGKVTARVGQLMVQGSPIGRAGTDRPQVTVELRREGEAIAIAPLAASP